MGWPFRTLATQDVTKDGFELEEYELASSPLAAGHGIRRLHWLRQLSLTLWLWELLSLLTSATCIGAIIVFLAHYDGKPMPSWSYGLTLNSLISILSSVARSAMLLPIAEVLSQLKWCWFVGRQRPLLDFERFDAASRGPWGSLMVLFNVRLWSLGAFAAALTLATLAIEPCLQQIPMYPARAVEVGPATMLRSTTYADVMANPGVVDGWALSTGSKGAAYIGLYGNSELTSYSPTCSTGNCTWPTYSSLAMCHACASHAVYRYDHAAGPENPTVWWSPIPGMTQAELWTRQWNFLQTNQQYSYIAQTYPDSGVPNLTVSWNFKKSENQTVVGAQMMYWPPDSPANNPPSGTFECQLYFCVQTYRAETVNGVFNETVISEWPKPNEKTPTPGTPYVDLNSAPTLSEIRKMWNYTLTPPDQPDTTYTVDRATYDSMRDWLGIFFSGSVVPRTGSGYTPISATEGVAVPEVFYTEFTDTLGPNITISNVSVPSTAGPDKIFARVAASLTSHIRTIADPSIATMGTASSVKVFVQARWLWAVQPMGLLALTMALMGATIRTSARTGLPTWKSSSLAVLLLRLDSEIDDGILAGDGDETERRAAAYAIRMGRRSGTWRMAAEER